MIEKAVIQNFQSHKHTLLEFHKGMNVIVGESDSGKSAILRALIFAIKNKSIKGMSSWWGGNTSVDIQVKEGTITRIKTEKGANVYELDDTDFVAFNKDIPEEIEKALRMDDINIQSQHDVSFLISETPGKVAAHFNKIAKLDKIDKGLFRIQHGERDSKTGKVLFTGINILKNDITYTEKEIDEKKEQLKEFEDLDQFENDLIHIEVLEAEFNRLNTDIAQLTSLFISYRELTNKIEIKSEILLMENSIDNILKLYEKKKKAKQNYKTIKKLSLKIHYSQEAIKEAEKQVLAESHINNILETYQEHKKAQLSGTQLTKLSSTIQVLNEDQEKALNQLTRLEIKYKKDFPKICPLCNTKVK